jgi:RecA/RadA recombinase
MPIKIVGNLPDLERKATGFWSFDQALKNSNGEIGLPQRTAIEVYGYEGVGKSTWCQDIASRINPEGTIVLGALETTDPKYVHQIMEYAGFSGILEVAGGETDEAFVTNLISIFSREDVQIGILDSVGAISPIAETDGDVGEANMGRRAHIMAQFSRRVQNLLRNKETPSTMFMISHLSQIIGGRGSTTTGGEAKKFLCAERIRLSRAENFDDGSYLLQGKMEKNRWGVEDKIFQMFYLSGKGFHIGMSNVFDCITLGLAKRDRVIKIGDDGYGFLSKLIGQAQSGDEAVFIPFKELLNTYEKESK